MLVYDLEIIKAIPNPKEPLIPNIAYCGGWNDHPAMGISVVCAYDFYEDRYRTFCADNLSSFYDLAKERSCLVSFNGIRFDNEVLRANYPQLLGFDEIFPRAKCFDILRECWRALGLNPDNYEPHTHGGLSLDMVCKANIGQRKTGHGEIAPVDWQRGNVGNVIDYCLQDVALTVKLVRLLAQRGFLFHPRTNQRLQLRLPSSALRYFSHAANQSKPNIQSYL